MLAAQPTPLEQVTHPLFESKALELFVKREDLLDARISGNKWHKLHLNLARAQAGGCNRVLSFGGAFSNHLHALAWAGNKLGIKTTGVVRGELVRPLNPTLQDAMDWGMKLIPVSRDEYRRRGDPAYQSEIAARLGCDFVIPEGGANFSGIEGCCQWGVQIREQCPDLEYLCVACGTGATLAGLAAGVGEGALVLGISALKGDQDLQRRVSRWLDGYDSVAAWDLKHEYHFGGFAKLDVGLLRFMDTWHTTTRIPIEPIYTAKLVYGVFALAAADYFRPGGKVVIVHTGGLQGIRGMQRKIRQLRGLST